jgi:hypothetical protein
MRDREDRNRYEMPPSLRVVAYVTIFFGITSAIEVVVGLFQGKVNFNLGVLQIPAGFGLLRLSQGWRTYVLFTVWLGILIAGGLLFALGYSGEPFDWDLLPGPIESYGREVIMTYCAVWLAYLVWEYRVLTNSRVRWLFGV